MLQDAYFDHIIWISFDITTEPSVFDHIKRFAPQKYLKPKNSILIIFNQMLHIQKPNIIPDNNFVIYMLVSDHVMFWNVNKNKLRVLKINVE